MPQVLSEGNFTSTQLESLTLAARIAGSLSLFGSTIIILLYWKTKRNNKDVNLHFQCVFWMSVSDIIGSFSYLVASDGLSEEWLCHTQAISQQISLATSIWAGIIGVDICLQTRGLVAEEHLRGYIKYYHLIAWPWPLISSAIIYMYDLAGDADGWCWIDRKHSVERLALWYLPVWTSIFVSVLSLYFVVKAVSEYCDRQIVLKVLSTFGVFNLFFILLWIPGTLHRILNVYTDKVSFPLVLIHSFCEPIQGFVNFCIYVVPLMIRQIQLYRESKQKDSGLKIDSPMFVLANLSYHYSTNQPTCKIDVMPAKSHSVGGLSSPVVAIPPTWVDSESLEMSRTSSCGFDDEG